MGMRIRCSNCKETVDFEIFMIKSANNCPNCNKVWDFSNISRTKLREY
jgi:uncharacterized protein (DUF983 family)